MTREAGEGLKEDSLRGRLSGRCTPRRFHVAVSVLVCLVLSFLSLKSSPFAHYVPEIDWQFTAVEWGDCVVVVMLSEITEEDLRKWHRETYRSQVKSYTSRILLRFGVPLSSSQEDVMKLRAEIAVHNDTFELLQTNVTKGFPASSNFEVMRRANSILDGQQCKGKYFLRAESSYVINYKMLARAIERLPSESLYFGSMVTSFPTPLLETRVAGGLGHSHLPTHAYGGIYGVSDDVLRALIDPMAERTVVRKDIRYEIPWQDGAIGLALFRSLLSLTHIYYLKGLYHMCLPTSIPCAKYKDYIAFKIPAENGTLQEQVMADMNKVLDIGKSCQGERDNVDAILVRIHQESRSVDSTLWPIEECEVLSAEGEKYALDVKNLAPIAAEHISEDTTCAEEFYLNENPQVAEMVKSGTFKSGRHHFAVEGWKDRTKNYFCPDYCQGRNASDCLQVCDKEQIYLEQYGNVKAAVDSGKFASGRAHYDLEGKRLKHMWSCLKQHPKPDQRTKKLCLHFWSVFVKHTSPIVKTWSLWGEPNDLPEEKCKAAILIDGRGGPWIDYTLRVHRRFLGPDWRFYLIGPPHLAQDWRKQFEGPMLEVVDLPMQFGNLSVFPKEVFELYRSKWLWGEAIKCEYILHTHSDVMMLRPGVDDFLSYAYAGAPVEPELYPVPQWRRICVSSTRCGGGGGFSIRRKSFNLRALNHCAIKFSGTDSEDMWYPECIKSMGNGSLLAHPTESNRFSLGGKCEVDNPVGMHHTWLFCGAEPCVYAIADSMLYREIYGDDHVATAPCFEGETFCSRKYGDVTLANNTRNPGWDHYVRVGKNEGRQYRCFDPVSPPKQA